MLIAIANIRIIFSFVVLVLVINCERSTANISFREALQTGINPTTPGTQSYRQAAQHGSDRVIRRPHTNLRGPDSGLARAPYQPYPQINPKKSPSKSKKSQIYYGDSGCRNEYDFDYLLLSLQWGPGVCATSDRPCERIPNQRFTIHGLWLQKDNKQEVQDCCFDNTFDYKLIEEFKQDLDRYWFSYYSYDSTSFLSHEWLKHGTCARNIPNLKGEKNFFETTLNLVKKLPILARLKSRGIVPGPGQVYNYRDIMNAVGGLTEGKRIGIHCLLQPDQPNPMLVGINVCFDKDLMFTDCKKNPRCEKPLQFLDLGRAG